MPELVDKIEQYLRHLSSCIYYGHTHHDNIPPILSSSEQALCKIILDLRDRRGLKNEWESTADSIQEEICEKWLGFINDAIPEFSNVQDLSFKLVFNMKVVQDSDKICFERSVNAELEYIQDSSEYYRHDIKYACMNNQYIAFITCYFERSL